MSDNQNLAIGAGVGAVAGAGVGLYKAAPAKEVKDYIKENFSELKDFKVGSEEFKAVKDEFVLSKLNANVAEEKAKGIGKEASKVTNDYANKLAKEFDKLATSTKAKYAAAVAVAGAAIGAGVAFAVNKFQANKAEKTEA